MKNTYIQLDSTNFTFQLTDTRHSWAIEDINLISGFLSENLLGVTPDAMTELCEAAATPAVMPDVMLTTDELAQKITGKQMPADTKLCDIYKPLFEGQILDPDTIDHKAGRCEVMRVLAQMECALKIDD